MKRLLHPLGVLAAATAALAFVAVEKPADAQRANGTLVFTRGRPPRTLTGNVRGWASSNRVSSYEEDTQSHVWRVNMFVFLPSAPRGPDVTLSWFKVEGRERRYIQNETVGLSNPPQRNFFHSTVLQRHPDHFQPMERYEAILASDEGRGQRPLARGTIELRGQVERRSGVVDFTRDGGT
jgi:hypothetical protein